MHQGTVAAVPKAGEPAETVEKLLHAAISRAVHDSYFAGTCIREIEIEVRMLVATQFTSVIVVEHFAFSDGSDSDEWHMRVRLPGNRLVDISHV